MILYGDFFVDESMCDVEFLIVNIMDELVKENLVFRSKFINVNLEFF